jgi:hypothetical protein
MAGAIMTMIPAQKSPQRIPSPSLALGDLQLELSMESTGATARESLYDEDDDR